MVDHLRASELFSLANRTAVVTGGSGFLGRCLCETLLANDARVIAIGRSAGLLDTVQEWQQRYGEDRAAPCRVDMYDLPALSRTLDAIARDEEVDIVVNNAHEMGPPTGFNTHEGTLDDATIDQWQRNLTGGILWAVLTTQRIGGAMKRRGRGSIVNIASMYAEVAPNPRLYEGTEFINPPGYSASKAGLLALTRYTASFWGPFGIRANAILPGPFSNVDSDAANAVPSDNPFLDRLRARTLLGRLGAPRELSGALLYLASDASSFVTGQGLLVDGGWTTT